MSLDLFFIENLLFQSSTFTAIFISLLLFLYTHSFITRNRKGLTKSLPWSSPPEAGGAWPLIGHLHLLGGAQPPHVTLAKMAEKYGPIFTIRLGVHKTLVVSSKEMARECFTINDKAFASRPTGIAFEVLGYNYSMIGFCSYGPYWRHVRKLATIGILSARRTEMLKHIMESEVKFAMKESYYLWRTKKTCSEKVTEMKKWIGDITLNIMFRIVMGKRFGGVGDEENERLRKAVRELFELSGSFSISDAMPYLRWLDLDGKEKAMKRTLDELDYFVRIWLEEHKRKTVCDAGEQKDHHHADFMDALLSTVDQEFDGRDPDTIIKTTCLAMIIGGTDTTTGTVTWALSLLLNNQNVLNKVRDELDSKIGRVKKEVEVSDLNNLVYLQAVMKETLRLYPAVPLGAPHESVEDCNIGGYYIPAGTRLLTNISKIHRDPILYHDPLEFRPERFLTVHKDTDFKGQHFEFIPFGAGRRICPGISFGLQMMQLMLANLLLGFDIVTADGKPVDMVEEVGLTSIKASPLNVILAPRLGVN
ncbi:hypothetical protein PIB30_041832 [Stylosanthes scabra]|uniref:Cytochrome P450 n=1 Tax=Stylosanthes scabra TaxID=79078 RepID=A0ABU6RF49_9FABA|nr:hypothetical protein [Stylosanthes scabra]